MAGVLAGAAPGQGRDIYAPAEVPPATYAASRYVDSAGCVFLRAGYGGQVVWVPQMTRDRQPICGQAPSLGAPARTTVAQAPGPVPAPNAAPAQAAAPPAPAPRRAPAVASAPRPAPVGVPMATIAGDVSAAPSPAPQAARPAAPAPDLTGRNPACPAGAPFGQRVETTDGRSGVLCTARPVPLRDGPVRVAEAPPAPAPVRSAAAPAEAAAPAAQTRRVRSDGRVPTTLTAAAGPVVVPEGYERVWDDGRLNPDRARGTLAGVQAMELMWTSTVPRRLIHRPTGRDMTAAFLAAAGAGAPEAAAVRVSTRGGDAAGKGETLVQAAAFRDAGNAASAAARLRAAGIAAEMRPADGFTLVLAGPFESRAAARAALPAVRRAGFGDAFLR